MASLTVRRSPEEMHELECLYRVMELARTDDRLSQWVFVVRADSRHVQWSKLLDKLRAYAKTLAAKDKAA